jgi:hypothetical protein
MMGRDVDDELKIQANSASSHPSTFGKVFRLFSAMLLNTSTSNIPLLQ